jgi:adenosine deaminase
VLQFYWENKNMKIQDIQSAIVEMPKVEIHLHLEGAFTFEFLYKLVLKYGGDSEINCIDDIRNKFEFKDFTHFINTWFWKNKFFRTPEDFEESTYETIKNLSKQNVVYAEVFFSPWDFTGSGLKMESIADATISGIRKAERDYPIKIGLIADLVRDHGAGTSMQRLDEITPFLNKGVIGIGLGGSEAKYPPILFKDTFIEAKKRGFRTTVHAGEAAGADSVWVAIKELGAERIGHGVRAIEDPELVKYLREKQTPLEICVTSNLKTKVFASLAEHPFPHFYKEGLMVTVNSDDPPMFGSNITDELLILHSKLDYSLVDLCIFTKNAADASFLDKENKDELKKKVSDFLVGRTGN